MSVTADNAYAVARVRADEHELFRDPIAARFEPPGEAREATESHLALPFFRDRIRLRTRFVDDFLRAGIAEGIAHVVLSGGGFDTRALRMPELASVTVYELDLPEQLAIKRALLGPPPMNVVEIPGEFTGAALEGQLRGPALFACEGVVGNLAIDAIDGILAMMARVGGRAVFDYGEATFSPAQASEHVLRAGFSRFEELGFDELWRRYLLGAPHPAAFDALMGIARESGPPRAPRS